MYIIRTCSTTAMKSLAMISEICWRRRTGRLTIQFHCLNNGNCFDLSGFISAVGETTVTYGNIIMPEKDFLLVVCNYTSYNAQCLQLCTHTRAFAFVLI